MKDYDGLLSADVRTPPRSAIVVFCLAALSVFGQELNPEDPVIIAEGLNRATMVVTGTFRVDWSYPWFDGWHYSGSIHVQESLKGKRRLEGPIAFRWREGYGASCLICERLSRLNGKHGIWLLRERGGEYETVGTVAQFCREPLPMESLKTVVELVKSAK